MDGLTFCKILSIFRKRMLGGTLNRACIHGDQLFLTFYKDGEVSNFSFKTTPPPSFEYSSYVAGDSPGALAQLSGTELHDVTSRAYDRLGKLHLSKRRPSGKLTYYTLVLEPMGNYANAFLLDEEGKIIFSVSSRSIDPDRTIGVGQLYSDPKNNKKYSLDNYLGFPEYTEPKFIDFVGFYPLTAKHATTYVEDIGFDDTADMIRREIYDNDTFYLTEDIKILPFPPHGEYTTIPVEQLSYKKDNKKNNENIKKQLTKFYLVEYKKYQRLIQRLYKELSVANDWEVVQNEAEIIQSNLHIIKGKGTYGVQVYRASGVDDVEYKYSSDLAPHEYVKRLFNRIEKLKRTIPQVKSRITEVVQLKDFADEQLYYIESASNEELKELSDLLNSKKQTTKRGKQTKQAKQDSKATFTEYTVGDAKLYIGRNSANNHALVFQFARSNDLWLHAQNIPSAHGILRKEGDITEDEIIMAAELVAASSKNKNELKVPVDYALKKYVKKPKNTPIGFVIYDNFSTVIVKPRIDDSLGDR